MLFFPVQPWHTITTAFRTQADIPRVGTHAGAVPSRSQGVLSGTGICDRISEKDMLTFIAGGPQCPFETKAKVRESARLPKAPGFKPSPWRWLATTRNPEGTGESAKCLIFNGPISMPVAFAYRKRPRNALRSFRNRKREGSNRVAFPPPVASFGNFSAAWAAGRTIPIRHRPPAAR
jgi:hypothetical protein